MNNVTLARAKAEAKRFLDRVAEMELARQEDEMAYYGCPESAALRRASMDLTRALTWLRSGDEDAAAKLSDLAQETGIERW